MKTEHDKKKQILEEIHYEPLKKSDLASLADLINGMRTYDNGSTKIRSTSQDYFHWMYFRNPAGKAIVYTAKHNDKIVSSFAMAPKKMKIGSDIITCGKTMDMFTRSDYQGLGLVKKLTGSVFNQAKNAGIPFWYVTPSVQSYPIFINKWGYKEEFQVIYRAAILSAKQIAEHKIKPFFLGKFSGAILDFFLEATRNFTPILKTHEIREETSFGPETDELWQKSCTTFTTALVRDSSYMNWRYRDNPDKYVILKLYQSGEIKGIIVLKYTIRKGLKTGEIVDYVCPLNDSQILITMIRHSLKIFKKSGCVMAQCWSIERTRLDSVLRRSGLFLKRKKLNFVLSPDGSYNEFYDKNAWLLTQGDGNDI